MTTDRIVFASCNDQDLENRLWPVIESRSPKAFIWGGDAIYADMKLPTSDWSTFPPTSRLQCATPQRLKALYRRQLSVPGYQRLLQQNLTIFGTFDDHDYGCNNADRTYEFRFESGMAYVDFLGEPEGSCMYQRASAGRGVYGVKLFDFSRPHGEHEVPESEAGIDPDVAPSSNPSPIIRSFSNQTVAVFVLDVRTHKTPWKKGSAAYQPDWQGDFLGEEQWKWFEEAISRSRAAVNVVVNGLQVHANRFPNGNIAEAWGKYPRAQQRLFDALLQDGVQSPILISGDVHMTQLMRKDCVRRGAYSSVPRPLVELTTSGMTHSWGTLSSPPSSDPEQQPTWRETYEAFVTKNMMRILHYVCPWTEIMKADADDIARDSIESGGGEGAKQGLQFSLEKNFGELEIEWEKREVSLRAIGEDPHAPPLLMARISIDQLSGRGRMRGGRLSRTDFRSLPESGEWICENHRGIDSQISHMIGHITTGIVLTTLVPIPFFLPAVAVLLLVRGASRSRSRSTKL